MTQTITRDELKSALNKHEDFKLVEALPEKYFNDAHIPNAVRINYDEVEAKAAIMLPNKTDKIVVYCSNSSCANSSKTVISLMQLGYTNVYKYDEGKQDWIEAGLPTQKTTL